MRVAKPFNAAVNSAGRRVLTPCSQFSKCRLSVRRAEGAVDDFSTLCLSVDRGSGRRTIFRQSPEQVYTAMHAELPVYVLQVNLDCLIAYDQLVCDRLV